MRDRGAQRFYAMRDAHWNITGIVGSGGAVAERYIYDAYGLPLFLGADFDVLSFSAYGWESLYAGYRYDSDTALYLARRRAYNGALGTFVGRDPEEDGINLYGFVRNNPLSHLDPSGTTCCIYVWDKGTAGHTNVGHAALKCGNTYMSFWPNPAPGQPVGLGYVGPCTTHTLAQDQQEEGGPPTITCLTCDLDEIVINAMWITIARSCSSGGQFATIGSNCSSTVAQLLVTGAPACDPKRCPRWNPMVDCVDQCSSYSPGGCNCVGDPIGIDRPQTVMAYFKCIQRYNCNPLRPICCIEDVLCKLSSPACF